MATLHGPRTAASFEDESVTFTEIRTRAMLFAAALRADGVGKGDKVGLLMGNRLEWLIVAFGIQYLGATMVAMNTWYTAHELAYVLDHGDVSVLVTVERYLKSDYTEILGSLDPIASPAFPHLRRIVCLGGSSLPTGWICYDDYGLAGAVCDEAAVARSGEAVAEDDIAYLLYTSGSTSRPKGVMLTHGSLVENGFNIGERLHLQADDVLFLPVSLFWGLGCENAVPASWTHGVHIVLQNRFDAGEGLGLIERHGCSVVYGTSNITNMLFEHEAASDYDLSTLRKGMAGGSRRIVEEHVPLGCRAYGMTETYGYATVTDASDPIEKRVGSMGRPTPGNTLRIHSPETGDLVSSGDPGELRIKGHVFAGYYKNPEVTAESFDSDGFFRTGDLGYVDEDGFFLLSRPSQGNDKDRRHERLASRGRRRTNALA